MYPPINHQTAESHILRTEICPPSNFRPFHSAQSTANMTKRTKSITSLHLIDVFLLTLISRGRRDRQIWHAVRSLRARYPRETMKDNLLTLADWTATAPR
jgi:hypothetical protein